MGTPTLSSRVDAREIEQHLGHVWEFVRRAFRTGGWQPVRNLLETLAAQLRRSESNVVGWADAHRRLEDRIRELERAATDADDAHRWALEPLQAENTRLRSERNDARDRLDSTTRELGRQQGLLATMVPHGPTLPTPSPGLPYVMPTAGMVPTPPWGGFATPTAAVHAAPVAPVVQAPSGMASAVPVSRGPPGSHYRQIAPPSSAYRAPEPQASGGYHVSEAQPYASAAPPSGAYRPREPPSYPERDARGYARDPYAARPSSPRSPGEY